MATREQVDRQRQAQASLARRARVDLETFWRRLDLTQPEAARDALLEFLPLLTDRYGEAAAALAADYFDELADEAGVRTRARVAATVAEDVVHAQVRRTAGHLWTPTPEQMLAALAPVIDRYVKAPARDTLVESTGRARGRWARVPTGRETCAFCLVMASRGFVYETAATAGDRGTFHGDCDCQIVPDWSDAPVLDGYNPDLLHEVYDKARARAGRNTLAGDGDVKDGDSSILQELRRLEGIN